MSVNANAILFLLTLATLGFSETDQYQAFADSWPAATRGAAIILVSAVLLAAIGVAVSEISKTRRRTREKSRDDGVVFNGLCQKAGLSEPQAALLRRLWEHSRPPNPHLIFNNAKFFELGVEREVQSVHSAQSLQALNDTLASLRRKMDFSDQTGDASFFSSRQLNPGQKVALHPAAGTPLNVTLGDVSEIDFEVYLPKGKEEAEGFAPGAVVSVSFIRPGDAEYEFSTRVKARKAEGRLTFTHVTGIHRRQLREFLRLDTKLDAAFRLLRSDKNPDRAKGAERVKGAINDLSGGGAALRSGEEYAPGDLISLSFNFMGESFAGIKAKILRVVPKTVQGEGLFQHHVQFLEMENRVRERLIRLIFDKHRENLQWQ